MGCSESVQWTAARGRTRGGTEGLGSAERARMGLTQVWGSLPRGSLLTLDVSQVREAVPTKKILVLRENDWLGGGGPRGRPGRGERREWWLEPRLQSWPARARLPALSLHSWVTFGKLLDLSVIVSPSMRRT